jgi:UPF0716 family protein affecting phage T7 exclusion
MRRVAALAVLTAAAFATWLAWIAHGVLCEEGCVGRPWPLVAQLVAACVGLVLAVVAAQGIATRAERRARLATGAAALAYLAWAVFLAASV